VLVGVYSPSVGHVAPGYLKVHVSCSRALQVSLLPVKKQDLEGGEKNSERFGRGLLHHGKGVLETFKGFLGEAFRPPPKTLLPNVWVLKSGPWLFLHPRLPGKKEPANQKKQPLG